MWSSRNYRGKFLRDEFSLFLDIFSGCLSEAVSQREEIREKRAANLISHHQNEFIKVGAEGKNCFMGMRATTCFGFVSSSTLTKSRLKWRVWNIQGFFLVVRLIKFLFCRDCKKAVRRLDNINLIHSQISTFVYYKNQHKIEFRDDSIKKEWNEKNYE